MHEVLVHAAAITTFRADQKYLRQSAACIDFCAAIKHSLDNDEKHTPEGQLVVKPVTPSTTTTDRSDVVPDSQRARRAKPVTNSADVSEIFSEKLPDNDKLSRTTVNIMNKKAHEPSTLQERQHRQSIDGVRDILADQRSMNSCSFDDMSDYKPTATPFRPSSVVSRKEETTLYPTPTAFKEPDRSIISLLSAREALAARDALALKRRRTSYRGLTQLFQATQTNFEHSTPLEATTSDRDVDTSRRREGQSVCVDKYITIASTEIYGSTVSPISEGHTSLPSDRTGRASVETDIALENTKSVSQSVKGNSPSSGFSQQKNDQSQEARKEYSTQPNTFVMAQLQSPFYDPTFSLSQDQDASQIMTSTPVIKRQTKQPDDVLREEQHVDAVVSSVPDIIPSTITRPGPHESTVGLTNEAQVSSIQLHHSSPLKLPPAHITRQKSDARRSSIVSETFIGNINKPSQSSAVQPLSVASTNVPHNVGTKYRDFSACIPTRFAHTDEIFCCMPEGIDTETTLDSPFLKSLKTPKKVKFSSRDLRTVERGYWLIDLQALQFSSAETRQLWRRLTNVITKRSLYWVSLQFDANSIRVYTFGQDAMAVWTVIYASAKKVKQGISWFDGLGERVISV